MPPAKSADTEEDRTELLRRIEELETRLEAAQVASARRLQFAVEAAPNGIIMTDAEGRIVFANGRARSLFGYSEKEMEELRVEELMPERFRRHHGGLRERYHHDPEQRPMGIGRDLFAKRKDGREFPVEIGLTPVEIDGERLTLGMIADITERKRAEEALRDQARILASLHEAVFTIGGSHRIETWNRGAEYIFGWTEDEIIGEPVSKICPVDDLKRYSERILPAVLAEGHYESTLRCRRRNAQEVTVAIRASLADSDRTSEADSSPRVIVCANDISRQKELEDEIVQISEKEQRRIGQDLHDDLCQQLASIACLAKVLRGQVASKGNAETATALDQIGEMLSSANVRAREISRGLAPAVIQREGLTSALEELASRTKRVFGVPCRFHCPDPIFVEDEKTAVQLYRIAQEATANAVKHSDATEILIELTLTPGHLRLRVHDDGRGLPLEAAKRSSGLGLLTMNYRAGILDGELEIQSSPGRGTTIICTAPHGNE
ncbi:MAG: PAS domain S-box protein [Verrucomicrobiae bacterium]|nr:PAS domain S-box protein [Verrucomicrobiae bacterium]